MIVRVKKSVGVFGHVENGVICPKNHDSGPFTVSEEKGKELIGRGIVDQVAGDNTPATSPAPVEAEAPEAEAASPAPVAAEAPEEMDLSEMTRPQLLELAEKRGLEVSKRAKKEDILEALKGAAE